MPGTPPTRRRSASSRGADSLLGYLIPLAFIVLAGYQQVTQGSIDKYVVGALLIFGLGALGWRLDVLFEGYMRVRYPDIQQQNSGQGNGGNEPAEQPTNQQ